MRVAARAWLAGLARGDGPAELGAPLANLAAGGDSVLLLRMVTPPGPKKHRSASLEHVLRAEWLSAMLLRGVTPPGSRGGAGRPGLEVLGDAGFVDMIPENPRPGRVGKHGWNRRGGGEVWTC